MLYYLFTYLDNAFDLPGAGLFQFITFRAAAAIMVSLLISLVFGGRLVNYLRRRQVGETVRDLGLEGQLEKQGTPTMGGLMILAGIAVAVFLWGDLTNPYIWIVLLVTLAFGLIGFFLRHFGYPMAPLVLGIVLGDLLEKNLRRALILSDGDLTPLFTRPIAAAVAALIFATIAWRVWSLVRPSRTGRAPA